MSVNQLTMVVNMLVLITTIPISANARRDMY